MTTHEQLQEVFQTVFADDSIELTPQTTAHDIAQWDSVAHINLMFSIEQAFGIQFAGNELAEFANIGELEKYLETRRS
ncbi:MAG: acyl carrier protein [Phycisphaerales bacterium]|nr:acyl carrier protein [Phycisphaerales bacterium]